jgi:hypothetical protein
MDKFIPIILSIEEYKVLNTFAQKFDAIRRVKTRSSRATKYETPFGMFNVFCYIQDLELSIQLLGLCVGLH